MKKIVSIALLFSALITGLVLAGCIQVGETKFVCPDGTTVKNASECPTAAPTATPTPTVTGGGEELPPLPPEETATPTPATGGGEEPPAPPA